MILKNAKKMPNSLKGGQRKSEKIIF